MTSQTTIPVGIYWKPGVWDLARSAYVADLDTDPDSPGAFVGWLAQALERHARRSRNSGPTCRGRRSPPRQVSTRKSFSKKHDLPASTIEAVEDAIITDRQELGRAIGRSRLFKRRCSQPPRKHVGAWAENCPRLLRSSATDRRGAARHTWLTPARPLELDIAGNQ